MKRDFKEGSGMKLVGTYNSAIKEEGNDHEIEFHEIEIAIFHEIKNIAKLIMRSKLTFFRRSNFFAKLIRRSKRP